MALKRTTADRHFSRCVRLRADWICDYCGIDLKHDHGSLHCSHYISRNYKIIRFNPFNALAHCYSCHDKLGGGRWGGGNHAEFAHHFDEMHGEDIREMLRIMSKYPFPRFKSHEKEIADHYRKEANRLEEMRNDGITGRIEFDNYDGCQEINELMEKHLVIHIQGT